MPEYVVERVADALNSVRKPINGSRVHLFGVAYKKDVGDVRESPALDILELLSRTSRLTSSGCNSLSAGKIPLDMASSTCRIRVVHSVNVRPSSA